MCHDDIRACAHGGMCIPLGATPGEEDARRRACVVLAVLVMTHASGSHVHSLDSTSHIFADDARQAARANHATMRYFAPARHAPIARTTPSLAVPCPCAHTRHAQGPTVVGLDGSGLSPMAGGIVGGGHVVSGQIVDVQHSATDLGDVATDDLGALKVVSAAL